MVSITFTEWPTNNRHKQVPACLLLPHLTVCRSNETKDSQLRVHGFRNDKAPHVQCSSQATRLRCLPQDPPGNSRCFHHRTQSDEKNMKTQHQTTLTTQPPCATCPITYSTSTRFGAKFNRKQRKDQNTDLAASLHLTGR